MAAHRTSYVKVLRQSTLIIQAWLVIMRFWLRHGFFLSPELSAHVSMGQNLVWTRSVIARFLIRRGLLPAALRENALFVAHF